jgi:alpha-beta hydrolase superfamily lysophospholipase
MDSAPRPLSLWFGPPERPLLGFYHPPSARLSGVRACAIVLCYPFGHEYTAVYQVYRQLAERLSAAGFPVLRFDYDGTGDSAGDDEDPGRLRAWLESIGTAIRLVQKQSGTEEVCLFGLRLGATLAYLAAREHRSVTSLVLWAPALTGKAYLREVRAMRLLRSLGPRR